MKHIETEILIAAEPEKIWRVLMDFANYPTWNPFIQSIAGEQAVGKKLQLHIKPPDSNGMTFKPVIVTLEPNRELRWKGTLGIPGIFDGEHYFTLEKKGEKQTKFTHGEKFTGILVAMMGGALAKTERGFGLMNEALKKECEQARQ